MKRSPELRGLSHEHHHGLVAARRLRQASAGERPVAAAARAFIATWRDEIVPHFRCEEEILLPEFARVAGANDPLIVRVLTEHVALRDSMRDPPGADEERQRVLAGATGQALDDHIRFEERVLFPEVEKGLDPVRLRRLAEELARAGQDRGG